MHNSLNELNIGESCIIKELLINNSIRRRLQDVGIIKGTKIECVLKSPSGDPTAYKIRGAVIAIRNSDASMIHINKLI